MMTILITRPEPDGSRLARILKKMGYESRLASMMAIENLPNKTVDVDGVQALLVTSANGARALGQALKPRNILVFAVGEATAEALHNEGFSNVKAAGGDVTTLAERVKSECDPKAGKLVHIAGSHVAGDLSGLLAEAGFQCDRTVLYEAKAATSLDPKVIKEIKDGNIEAVLFYSPRTGAIFADLAKSVELVPHLASVTAFCLSRAVADKISDLEWQSVEVATEPSQENLLALLAAVSQSRQQEGKPGKPREREMSDKESGKSKVEGKTAVPSVGAEDKSSASADPADGKASGSETAKPKSRAGLVLVALIFVFCLGLAAWPLLYPRLAPYLPAESAAIIAGQFGTQETADTPDMTAAIKEVETALKSDYTALSDRIRKLEDRPETTSAAPAADDGRIADLSSQLDAQEQKLTTVLAELSEQKEAISGIENAEPATAAPSPEVQNQIVDLKTTLLDLKTQISNLQSDLANEREEVKSQSTQIFSLETALKSEIADKSKEAAENQRTLMLLAIGQLQRETRSDEPFENGLQQVSAVSGDKFADAIDKLKPIAEVGAPTMTTLQKDFTAIATDISQSARLPSEETWYGQALHRIASAVKFRRVDETDGDDADAVVARAEQALDDNDLNKAVTEIEKLSGSAAEVASPWLEKAKTRLTVEQSIAGLLQEATATAVAAPASN
tara:strand:+ start:75567 stop:77600 length:2034 start_codon:yes stop_codon:yes gene_type:complete